MSQKNEPWYAAKSVYYYIEEDLYEERIVIHKATGFDDAWEKNEKETRKYIREMNEIGVKLELVKTIEIFHIFEDRIKNGSEVFSSMRETEKSRAAYIKSTYTDGLRAKFID